MPSRQTRPIDKKPIFLAAFKILASIREAAKAAKIDRSLHYQWLEKDPEYAKAFEQAKRVAAQEIEDDIIEWARRGIFEPIVYQGRFQFAERERTLCKLPDGREVFKEDLPETLDDVQVVSERKVTEQYGPPLGIYRRSETLLARLAKALMPERYGDRTEVSGPGGGPLETSLNVVFVKPKE